MPENACARQVWLLVVLSLVGGTPSPIVRRHDPAHVCPIASSVSPRVVPCSIVPRSTVPESSSARNLNRLSLETAEPLSPEDHSYPVRAFRRATLRYYSFLQALLEGLLEYEAKKGERHATQPLPVA